MRDLWVVLACVIVLAVNVRSIAQGPNNPCIGWIYVVKQSGTGPLTADASPSRVCKIRPSPPPPPPPQLIVLSGLSGATNGQVGGVPVPGSGSTAIEVDDATGHLIIGTTATNTGQAYGIREVTLDASGANALVDASLVAKTAPAPNSGVRDIAILPSGNILAIEATLSAPQTTIGLFEYDRSTGAPTPWPIIGAPAGAATALVFDRSGCLGAGAAFIAFRGSPGAENVIISVPFGGGVATTVRIYSNATFGGGGFPTGLDLSGTGELLVSHDHAVTGATLVDRTTGLVTPLAPGAFGTGHHDICVDLVGDGAFVVADTTGATPATARQVRSIPLNGGAPSVLLQLPGSDPNGLHFWTGGRIYGEAKGLSVAGTLLRVSMLSPSQLGTASGLRCAGADASTVGALLIGSVATCNPLPPPFAPGTLLTPGDILLTTLLFDPAGTTTFPIALPSVPALAYVKVYSQFAAVGPGGVNTSAGLEITLLP